MATAVLRPASAIPVEIHSKILSHVRVNRKHLLVSKTWHQLLLPLLLRRVALFSEERVQSFITFLQTYPGLCEYVHALRIYVHRYNQSTLRTLISLCGQMPRLKLLYVDPCPTDLDVMPKAGERMLVLNCEHIRSNHLACFASLPVTFDRVLVTDENESHGHITFPCLNLFDKASTFHLALTHHHYNWTRVLLSPNIESVRDLTIEYRMDAYDRSDTEIAFVPATVERLRVLNGTWPFVLPRAWMVGGKGSTHNPVRHLEYHFQYQDIDEIALTQHLRKGGASEGGRDSISLVFGTTLSVYRVMDMHDILSRFFGSVSINFA